MNCGRFFTAGKRISTVHRLLFDIPEAPTLPVRGEEARFPVHRIFCVGRNYADHAREMGVEPDRETPFYFTKSAHALCPSGSTTAYPPGTQDFHHEMELVVAIGRPVFRAERAKAAEAVFGFACGLDMTRRDLQQAAKDKRRPWDIAKDVENSAVIAAITRAGDFGAVGGQRIALSVNGETRQEARLSDLIHPVDAIIAHLSTLYHLVPGDLIFTGTPAGVGPVQPGDRLNGTIDGCEPVELSIGQPEA